METYKLILLMLNCSIGGVAFAQFFIDGDTIEETFLHRGFLAGLSTFFVFLLCTFCGGVGILICFVLLLIYEGLRRVFKYLEIRTIWDWYVLGKKDFFKESNNETQHYSKEQVLVFLNLRTQQLLKSKKLIKRIKGNIRNHFIQKINKQENFVTRADNDYRMFLRGGDINKTPETPFNGIIHCCGVRFDVNEK